MTWVDFKLYLSEILGLTQDALHVYVAVLLQLGAALVLRRSLASPLPWLIVLASLLLNEWVDLRGSGDPIERWQVLGGLKDIWNTMALPILLWLIARFSPSLLTGRAAIPGSGKRQAGD